MDKSISPKWKRPEEVMKFHRMKQKKRALFARINGNDHVASMSSNSSNSEDSFTDMPLAKRRNPFVKRCTEVEPKSEEATDESGLETDMSGDTTLFHILSQPESYSKSCAAAPQSFTDILKHLNQPQEQVVRRADADVKHSDVRPPIDWSLKSKVRFMSSRPFSWSANLKTCEEASGITGFARCLDMGSSDKNRHIDTSSNAKFHQCCLYWQHPSLPWLQMFPRNCNKISSSFISAQLQISSQLFSEWKISFKSLYQLVRARQCPFFYMLANHFYCLFRTAGFAGESSTHAIITPTTRGFRKLLQDEGVEFTMPLSKKGRNTSGSSELDMSQSSQSDTEQGDMEDEDDEDWLNNIGIDCKEMKRLTATQKVIERNREKQVDGSNQSLVMVRGEDMQGLFNLLVNCKSCVAGSGPLAGVPPTLLAPVAFQLATLKSCSVKNSLIKVDGVDFHSVQVEGPILPHSLRQMCLLLDQQRLQYSASVATVKQSAGFTLACKDDSLSRDESCFTNVFLKENLSDCGLSKTLVDVFCDADSTKYNVIENLEPVSYDC